MSLHKKWLAAVLTSVMIFSITGCASNGNSTKENNNTTEAIQTGNEAKTTLLAARDKLLAAESFQGSLKIDLAMSDDTGESSNVITTTDLTLFASPLLAKIDTMSTDGNEESPQSRVYIEEKDGVFTSYMENAGSWRKQEMDKSFIDYALDQYDPRSCFDAHVKAAYELKEAGTEKIGEVEAKKYEGIIPGASVQTVAYETGLFSFIGLGNLPGNYFVDIPDVKVCFWISSEGYPVKYSLDLTEVLQQFFDRTREEMVAAGENAPEKVTIAHYIVEGNSGQFGVAEAFEIPQEAKDAVNLNETDAEINGSVPEILPTESEQSISE